MTEPTAEPGPEPTATATTASPPVGTPSGPAGRRLRGLPALAIASMLMAGGLLLAIGGISRLVGPAPATPTPAPTPAPTVVESPAPVVTAAPTQPRVPTRPGPSGSPQGDVAPPVHRGAREGAPGV